ncbi:tyrosine-type recombinase/integrase [Massilia antarctica]|uniref:tyrosine-type recombinase/integrase n=1 Tax=Massilia antarctica TaxID=2765360 RepID=UPI0022719ED0|nr:integrase arm-type DNA-binding domain-containing protein [Massilia sp. H27-R4]MCY0914026.1 integrase arm-type DNA-binding domain-containing protein [Massilia sp. H27-R4]
MPKLIAPLTDIQIRTAKPLEKPYKLSDGGGLYVEIMPHGSKLWRMKVRQANGKESILSFGAYPGVALVDARAERAKAKQQQAAGIDPAQNKRIEKQQQKESAINTFELIAREWHANKSEMWKENTAKEAINRLQNDVFPMIGKRAIVDVDAPLLLDVLRLVEKRGAVDMAARLGQLCSQIFRFAIAKGLIKYNPVPDMRGALKPRARGHHAAIGTDELPAFLVALQKNEAEMYLPTRILMRMMLLVFIRTSELVETPWVEIDLENESWVIPWQRMKMGKKKINPRKLDHHVNLPRQGWALLRDLHAVTGGGIYLFPNRNDHKRPASNGAILQALKRMGYGGKHTGHGFRSLAMGVIKARLKYRHEVVNRQLAHGSDDEYGEAYDREQFIEERKAMMQAYADYIDLVQLGENVIPGNSKRA